MLYPKKDNFSLNIDLFENPTNEFRAVPFWAWNTKLSEERLNRQIDNFCQMGFGGFHIHSRFGLCEEYLGKEFFGYVNKCVSKAKEKGLFTFLYDEDRWPSGTAGGKVTKTREYSARYLLFTTKKLPYLDYDEAKKNGGTFFVGSYYISLNKNGELDRYEFHKKFIDNADRYAYVCTNEPEVRFNGSPYTDLFNHKATDEFIRITHESYKKNLGKSFGKSVPAIFTDEPQFVKKGTLDFSDSKDDIKLAWTCDFNDTFISTYGYSLYEKLPELLWDKSDGKISKARYDYHDHICCRFAQGFCDRVGDWCDNNGIYLTGHVYWEPTLQSQTEAVGDAMRLYKNFHIPGIDILEDRHEYSTAKQCQSVVHQCGREGMLSEEYGVTGWDFDFKGHKMQGDWQAALGVTLRVPHLTWMSMNGSAKRDYPASIGSQSPWYREYGIIENHFARINTALTRGKPIVKIAVIHPIESFWLHYGCKEKTSEIRRQLDENFEKLINILLFNQLDFDFISESLLPLQNKNAGKCLTVGEMTYDVVLVPNCEVLKSSTLEVLQKFSDNGGNLIFSGFCPFYLDGIESDKAKRLYEKSKVVSFDEYGIVNALKEFALIDIRNSNGTRADNFIYNLREDSDCRWLFIAQCRKSEKLVEQRQGSADIPVKQTIKLTIKGSFKPYLYNTMNGEISELSYDVVCDKTILYLDVFANDSLLLKLVPTDDMHFEIHRKQVLEISKISENSLVEYELSEPNVLLLDTAQYSLDGEEYSEITNDILKIDEIIRRKLKFETDVKKIQPWAMTDAKAGHRVKLKMTFESEICFDDALIALENAENCLVTFNGTSVDTSKIYGYYVDEDIKTVKLPTIVKGRNVLEILAPIDEIKSLEYFYILGSFGISVRGTEKSIVPLCKELAFDDIVHQGLCFYGGNVIYNSTIDVPEGCEGVKVSVKRYRGALIKVFVDDVDKGYIFMSPNDLIIKGLAVGKHNISYVLFGNRYNTFAALHNADENDRYCGPAQWKTTGDKWCDEYKFRATGILSAPQITYLCEKR